jgi:hypothetical protein
MEHPDNRKSYPASFPPPIDISTSKGSQDTLLNVIPPRFSKSYTSGKFNADIRQFQSSDDHQSRVSMISSASSEIQFEKNFEMAIPSLTIDDAKRTSFEKRRKIMEEIVATEIRYVADLLFLKENYTDPLTVLVDTPSEILTKRQIHDIFSYHQGILAINQEIKSQLCERIRIWSEGCDRVGDIFQSLAPFLRIYSLFLTNFSNAVNLVSTLLSKNQRFFNFVNVH